MRSPFPPADIETLVQARSTLEALWDCTCPEQIRRINAVVEPCERCDMLSDLDSIIRRGRCTHGISTKPCEACSG